MPTTQREHSCLGGLFSSSSKALSAPSTIPGFLLAEDAFTASEELSLLQAVDESSAPWTRRRTRVTKNYGPYYLYNERDTPNGRFRYTDGKVLHTPLPDFLKNLIIPILHRALPVLKEFHPNQVHVALYREGDDDKIRMHNDNKMGELGPFIVGMCLKGDCDMTFMRPRDKRKRVVRLPRGCVYVMTGESHFEWRHGILSGQTQGERVSFTLREVRKLAVADGVKVTKSSHAPSQRAIQVQMRKDSMRKVGMHEGEQMDIRLAVKDEL